MENKVDENSGRYDFSAGNPVARSARPKPENFSEYNEYNQALTEWLRDNPVTVKAHVIPIPDTPGARSIAEGNALRSEIFSILASQAASEIDAVLYSDKPVDVQKIKNQVLECGMSDNDILWQLIGWHYEALNKGNSEQKIGAIQFFKALDITTGPTTKIPNPNN